MQRDILIRELRKLIPYNKIIVDRDILQKYSEDKSTVYVAVPDFVVKPTLVNEIQRLLLFATKHNIPVICWGQGTSVTGSCLAFKKPSILMSLEKFNRILEIDKENLIAVVEPGVIVGDLKKEVERFNLFYPPDPASYESATIGGNIATGAGGSTAVKYGVTKDYVTGLEVILASGEILELGGKVVKKSSGYNLIDLFISSEGTLGIISKIYLKLIPKPLKTITVYVTFSDMLPLLDSVNKILSSNILPISLEYIDDTALFYLNKKFNLPDKEKARASLIIQLDYDIEEQQEFLIIKLYEILSKIKGFLDFYPLAASSKEKEIWQARRAIGEVFRENFKYIAKADIVVPRGKILTAIDKIKTLAIKNSVDVSCFGHAGDGNIHVNFLINNENFNKNILQNVYKIVKEIGGLPSGEHGIGVLKKDILKDFLGNRQIELMQQVKQIFDPCNILNPGKIFNLSED